MADTMQFDLVAPERRLASMSAREVQIPGAEGDLTAMPDHAPLITTLRPGILRAAGPEGETAFLVTGGFAEIGATAATVLAEAALPVSEVTAVIMDGLLADARKLAEEASDDARSAATKAVADLEAARGQIGV